ncbi:MAG TPA: VWA domain-containing protein [Aggregatilineales bacterium]|nr:VWA domain-containing protein [Anaerolineales bacterium]HRE48138.1 VWA domain-containing protein [Aggregatilineales bacterium]
MTEAVATETVTDEERRRWRLILGRATKEDALPLSAQDAQMDAALEALYADKEFSDSGGLGDSAPQLARWLGDIRTYFPKPVVQMLQKEALQHLSLNDFLREADLLKTIELDVHLMAKLVSLNETMTAETRDTARQVVRKVTEELQRKLSAPLRTALNGAMSRALRTTRPRYKDMDWARTILTNLKHYQPAYRTVIPERRIGFGHHTNALRDVILCLDESGSMATSVVYAGIYGAVMASLPAVKTHLVAFDTNVVDLTAELRDPVDILFGVQLGGGTDINQALAYAQRLIKRPADTILVLISDLFEGGDQEAMIARAGQIAASGVQMVTLLTLSDDGIPNYDHEVATTFAALGIASFACTPDMFPNLMAAAIERQDLSAWAGERGILRTGQP